MDRTESKVDKTNLEGGICLAIFTGFVLISMYHVKTISSGLQVYHDEYHDFAKGWPIIGKKRDAADYEWETAKSLFRSLFPWIIAHLLATEILRRNNRHRFIPIVQISFTIFYTFFQFNLYCVFLLVFQPFAFHIFRKTRRKSVIWGCAVFNLALLELFKTCEPYGCLSLLNITDLQHSIIVLAVYWINLRCICYYVNHVKVYEKVSLLNSISYCLYLPMLFFGPIINYDDFVLSHSSHIGVFSTRFKKFIAKLVRFLFWWVFTDLWLHYVYVNVISLHPNLVNRLDSLTLYGFGYCMGQFFHLKYVVMYGLSTTVAEFDNMLIPNVPKCIGRIHLYSDMWKYFDNGLYKFLVRYIYLPIREFTSCKYFASFVCFAFIYVWHGFMRTDILIWTFLNYLAVSVEYLCRQIYKERLRKHVTCYFDTRWEQRLICAANAPLLMLSAISNFYFFGGVEIGNVFVTRILTDKFLSTMLLLSSLYCCGQLSIMVKKWENPRKICTAK